MRPIKSLETPECIDCSASISSAAAIRCIPCSNKRARIRHLKIDWPSVSYIKNRIESTSYEALARELGVSSNAIRKHLKKHEAALRGFDPPTPE